MVLTRKVEQQRRDAFRELIEKRLNAIPKDSWKQKSHGSKCNGKRHADAMLTFATYFYPRCFKIYQFRSIMGLEGSSHNMEVEMDVLVQARVMEESKNNVNKKVYGLIASIKHHIDYRDQDEEKIEQQLKKLYTDGNRKANERAAKLNANDNRNQRKQTNQQDTEESPILDAQHSINPVHFVH